jgi:hypothetical protein
MDPVKVAGVVAWPVPENKKDVQQFLSFMNFYQRFIWAFSDIAWPLFDLTKNGMAYSSYGQINQLNIGLIPRGLMSYSWDTKTRNDIGITSYLGGSYIW